jgi:hypothetical protein
MAAPNIANLTTITGKTSSVSLTSTSATALLSNAASSNKVLKVNYIGVTNTTATVATITLTYYTGASLGGTAFAMSTGISVPAGSTLILLQSQVYLEENTSFGLTAGTANALVAICSYEDMS